MCEFHNVKGEDWSVSNELHRICKYQGAGNHNEKAEKAKETIIWNGKKILLLERCQTKLWKTKEQN